jgi:hypothetical protein
MLTIKTSANVPGNRQRRNFHCTAPFPPVRRLVQVGGLRLLQEWLRLFDAESRRLWLEARWRSHLGRVRLAQWEEQAMKIAECTAIATGPGQDPGVPAASGRHYLYAIVAGDEAAPILLWASRERMCTPSPTVAWPRWSAASPVPRSVRNAPTSRPTRRCSSV